MFRIQDPYVSMIRISLVYNKEISISRVRNKRSSVRLVKLLSMIIYAIRIFVTHTYRQSLVSIHQTHTDNNTKMYYLNVFVTTKTFPLHAFATKGVASAWSSYYPVHHGMFNRRITINI